MNSTAISEINSGLWFVITGLLIVIFCYRLNARNRWWRYLSCGIVSGGGVGTTVFHIAQTWNDYLITSSPGWVYYLGMFWWLSAIVSGTAAVALMLFLTAPLDPEKT